MKSYFYSGLALSAILALSGCGGGGGGGSSSSTATTGTGYYVDSAVSGVNYVCGDQNGTTDTEGMFKFAVGKDCTFKLGNIVLKSIAADKLIDKATIVEDNVSVAAFLQTVDVDGNASNGIQVTSEVVEAVTTALADTTEVPVAEKLDSVFTALKNDVTGYSGKVVSETEAAKHLEKTYEAVTKDLLAGKTYYVVHIGSTEHFVGKVSFNDEVTTETWTGLINDTGSETETVKLEGNKLIWTSDNSYSKVIGENSAGYLLVADYNGDDSSDGKSYLFTTQSKAEAFYNAKYPQVPATDKLSFATLKNMPMTMVWSDDDYEGVLYDGSTMTFIEYNDDNTTSTDEGTLVVDSTDSKKARWTSKRSGAIYDITLGAAEDVTTYKGKDVSSYSIKKVLESDVCVKSGTVVFEPADWTPTYWDGNSTQPITDIATFINQQITADSGWWDSEDNIVYMLAEHSEVSDGVEAEGDLVKAKAVGTRENCTEYCTIYERTDEPVGSWKLSRDGVLTKTIPNQFIEEYKFVDDKMQEAYNDVEGRISHNDLYIGLTPEIMQEIGVDSE